MTDRAQEAAGRGARRPGTASPRPWIRPSTVTRCTRCGRRWRRTARGPGCRRAAPGISSWPCTNWPPTPSATAPGKAGCGCGPRRRGPLRGHRRRRRRGFPADAEAADAALWHVEPGHGLWLVRRIADEASVQSDPSGTVAAISFRLGTPGPLAPFRLDRRAEGGCTILAVTGQLDLGSSGEFGGAVGDLIAATPGLRLILDMSALSLVGLLRTGRADHRSAADQPRPFGPYDRGLPAGPLAERLHEAGVACRFTLADSTAGAVAALTSPG